MKKLIPLILVLSTAPVFAQSSVLEEAGYILAQQTAFTGMSYLANKENYYGHIIVGALDLFFAYAGIQNGLHKDLHIQKIGYFLLSAGFAAKSAYTLHYGKDHSDKTRFWTNFAAYNVLVYSGYYLDTLSEVPPAD